MSALSSILTAAEHVAKAALDAVSGAVAPGSPEAGQVIATVAGARITLGEAITTAKALEGSKLGAQLLQLVTNIGDVDNDLDVTEQVAAALAPYLPIAAEVEIAAKVLKFGFDFAKGLPASTWAPAPRGGPPITEADWSHGAPRPQEVHNPSGAIGGEWPQPDP